ncbi:MAG: TlpA family protein disulfide reductase [Burkholderiales bacterium]|nr:TlpA family protein disulfide reductase [Opitutaceae bacterium]
MKMTPARRLLSLLALGFAIAGGALLLAQSLPEAPDVDIEKLVTTKVGGPMPAWSLTTLDGRKIDSASLTGKVVVVDFWATHCAPCVHELPHYADMQKKYADQGLVIIGVSVDRRGADFVKKFVERYGVNYDIAMINEEIGDALIKEDTLPLPLTFLVDRQGVVRHQKVGPMPMDEYEKLIQALL